LIPVLLTLRKKGKFVPVLIVRKEPQMSELKDLDLEPDICPFCGSDNVDPIGWKNGEGETGPSCNDCGATADSVEEWNTRPTEDLLRVELKDSEAKYDYLVSLLEKRFPKSGQDYKVEAVLEENQTLTAEIKILKAEAELGNIPYREAVALKSQLIATDNRCMELEIMVLKLQDTIKRLQTPPQPNNADSLAMGRADGENGVEHNPSTDKEHL